MYSFKYDGGNIILTYEYGTDNFLTKTITRTGRANRINEDITLDPEHDIVKFGNVQVTINDIFNPTLFANLNGSIRDMFQPGIEDSQKNVGNFEYTLTGDLKFDDDENGIFEANETVISKYLRKLGGERLDIWVEDHVLVSVPDGDNEPVKKEPTELFTELEDLVPASNDDINAENWAQDYAELLALELVEITLDHAGEINAALSEYATLSSRAKALLTAEHSKLISFRNRIEELEAILETEARLDSIKGIWSSIGSGENIVDIIVDTDEKTIILEKDEDTVYTLNYVIQADGKLAATMSNPVWAATARVEVNGSQTKKVVIETISQGSVSLLGLNNGDEINLLNRVNIGLNGFYFAPIATTESSLVIKGYTDKNGVHKLSTKAPDEPEYSFIVATTENPNIFTLTPDEDAEPVLGNAQWAAIELLGGGTWRFNTVGANSIGLVGGTEILTVEQTSLIGDWTGCCCWDSQGHECETTARVFEEDGETYIKVNSSMISGNSGHTTTELLDADNATLEIGDQLDEEYNELTPTRNPAFDGFIYPLLFRVTSPLDEDDEFTIRSVHPETKADNDPEFDVTIHIDRKADKTLWEIKTITGGASGANLLGWKDETAHQNQTTIEIAHTNLSTTLQGEFISPLPAEDCIKALVRENVNARKIVRGSDGFVYWDNTKTFNDLGGHDSDQVIETYPYKFTYSIASNGKLKLVLLNSNDDHETVDPSGLKATIVLLQNNIWEFESIGTNDFGLEAGDRIKFSFLVL
jgi:hypothetical protein